MNLETGWKAANELAWVNACRAAGHSLALEQSHSGGRSTVVCDDCPRSEQLVEPPRA